MRDLLFIIIFQYQSCEEPVIFINSCLSNANRRHRAILPPKQNILRKDKKQQTNYEIEYASTKTGMLRNRKFFIFQILT